MAHLKISKLFYLKNGTMFMDSQNSKKRGNSSTGIELYSRIIFKRSTQVKLKYLTHILKHLKSS